MRQMVHQQQQMTEDLQGIKEKMEGILRENAQKREAKEKLAQLA